LSNNRLKRDFNRLAAGNGRRGYNLYISMFMKGRCDAMTKGRKFNLNRLY